MILKGLVILVIYLVAAESTSSQSSVRRPNEYLAPPPIPRRAPTRLRLLRVSENSTVTKQSTSVTEPTTRNARWLISSDEPKAKSDKKEHLHPPPSPTQSLRDQIASGTHHQQHQSVIHPQNVGSRHSKKECNPCNKVPWIPMTRSLITSDAHVLHPSIASQYDSPPIGSLPLQTPGTSYGAPLPPLQPPPPSGLSNHPGSEYGPPPQAPKPVYGPPQSAQQSVNQGFGPPPSASQSIKPVYGPPPSAPQSIQSSYGPPPPVAQSVKPVYGPPPQSSYGPPPLPPKPVYQPPSSPSSHTGNAFALPPPPPHPPKLEYGPPSASKPPNGEYGPPPPLLQPFKTEYVPPPKPPKDEYGLPPPISQSINHQFGPPPPPPRPPKFEYRPPSHKPPRAPNAHFGIHGSPSKRPSTQYGSPTSPARPISEYGLPPPQKPPRLEHGSPHSTGPDFRPPPPPTSYDAVKQPSSPQLSPSYLPAPPVYEANNFRGQSHSTDQNFVTLPPHSNAGFPGVRVNNEHNNIDVVPSIPLIEDSHSVASHNPITSSAHGSSYTDTSSIHGVQHGSTTSGFNVGEWHKDETTHPLNDQLHLPSGDTYKPPSLNSQKPVQTSNPEPTLEVIPSIQVADFLSSIEYPLQIIQSPYIDITQPPQNFKDSSQSSSHSHSTYDEGEIIVGKPTLEVSKLNVTKIQNQSTSVELDQKEQQSIIHVTNASKTVSSIKDTAPSSGIIHSSQGNGFFVSENQVKPVNEDHQKGDTKVNINVLDTQDTTLNNGLSLSTVQIQPSIQTSAEGNSIIHQINSVFQSQTNTPSISSYPNNFKHSQSGYVVFQNFPQPPLSYLPEDVLKQKLPPPAPFQNNFQQNPYLPPYQTQSSHDFFQSTPQPQTTSFPHALKLDAPGSFLNPPPKNNEQYSTMTNTPSNDYSFWTSTPRPHSSISTQSANFDIWNQPTTLSPEVSSQKPFENPNQNIITAFAEAAGLLPPPPHQQESSNQSNKKTKQIQIIVPYTSSKELMQFKVQEENKPIFDSTGWLPITGDDILKQQGRKVPPPLVNCSDSSQSWQQQCQQHSWQEQIDYHQNQESRTVTATVPPTEPLKQITQRYPEKNYNELQHILASNIRNLLLGEEDSKDGPDSITLQRLQKNIDEWTALEYSKRNRTKYNQDIKKGVTSTTLAGISHQHLLQPSKKIPDEYLTTTPLTYDDSPQTENYIATAVPSFKRIKNTYLSSAKSDIFSTLSPFQDFEASASHSHTVRTVTSTSFETNRRKIKDIHKSETVPSNHQIKNDNHRWKIIESNYILPEAVTATTEGTTDAINTTTYPTTTTTTEPTTTTQSVTDVYSNSGHTTWDQIPLSISPITNEKVYVVTPVTTWKPEPTQSTSINDIFPFRNGPPSPQKLIASPQFSFKSPRFIVRPTPGTTIHRMFTVTSNDEDDSLNAIRTRESVKYNNADGYGSVGDNSSLKEDTTITPTPSGTDLLLGHPTLPTYTPPNGSRVLTDSGHSKVVTVASSATLTTPIRKKQPKKQSTVSTTKLFPVTTSRPQPRGASPRKLRPNRGSYAWQFPELSGHSFQQDDAEAIQDAVVELQKKQNYS